MPHDKQHRLLKESWNKLQQSNETKNHQQLEKAMYENFDKEETLNQLEDAIGQLQVAISAVPDERLLDVLAQLNKVVEFTTSLEDTSPQSGEIDLEDDIPEAF